MKLKRIDWIVFVIMILFGTPSYAHAMFGFGVQELTGLIIILGILFLVFLALRELFCWYWKINETISLLKEIRDLLHKSASVAKPESTRGKETT